MASPIKPSMDEILEFLGRHKALIVHCSGTPKGVGPGQKRYPADLQHVQLGKAQGGIACSVIRPGDLIHGPVRRTTGSVGLVIAPMDSPSLVAVDPKDAGSSVVNGIRVVAQEVDIRVTDLERCFEERGDNYNEWVLRDFKVIGVFVGEPAATSQLVQVPMPPEADMPPVETETTVNITTSQIAADFEGLPIFTLVDGDIWQWHPNGWTAIPHAHIYSAIHEQNYQAGLQQHVLPRRSIQRYFRNEASDRRVEVFLKPDQRAFPVGDKWTEFCLYRKWDEGVEKGVNPLEDAFQDLVDMIEDGKDKLSEVENQMVTRFWSLIASRSQSRNLTFGSESSLEPLSPSPLSARHLDYLERNHIFMAGTQEQLDRSVHGMMQTMAMAQSTKSSTTWCVARANEGQFLVSDNYHHRKAVPVSSTAYLIPGDRALQLDRSAVAHFNSDLLAASERYVFAKRLSECGIGIDLPIALKPQK